MPGQEHVPQNQVPENHVPEKPVPEKHVPKIGVRLPPPSDVGAWLADAAAFETAGAHSLWLGLATRTEDDEAAANKWEQFDLFALTAGLAAITYRAVLVLAMPDPGRTRTLATVQALSAGRVTFIGHSADHEEGGEVFLDHPNGRGRWIQVAVPQGRAAWRAILTDAIEREAAGVLVPAEPRLLDIMRNPRDPGGRRDLHLAQG